MFYSIAPKTDHRGSLFPCNLQELNFDAKRLFYIKDVPAGQTRGEHAHKETDQLLFCLSGNIEVSFFDGHEEKKFLLNVGDFVLEEKMTWTTLKFLKENSTLLVLSSKEFSDADYIRNKQEYLNLLGKE
jgi:dTDP-4-dehydrorhamnose 3,5-epimerase-like enzyme